MGLFGCYFCFVYCYQRRYSIALYAGLTYSIVLTIVHSDGTSILTLYTNKVSRTQSIYAQGRARSRAKPVQLVVLDTRI
jgi:hypothetical protein